ncbi:MAG: serine hydrolase [Herpetosiphonaceae bacterium]|nr:serine hydrolase [Herpetosiphonaceae bacterium]
MIQKHQLSRSTPEAQGIATPAIRAFVDAAEQSIHELHSFMLLRHGQVIAEGWWSPYGPELPHMLFSLSKSFTSTGIGLVVEAGLLSLDQSVVSLFPEDVPSEVSPHLAAMQVRHLLSMSTGHAEDTTGYLRAQQDGNWVKAFLAQPVEYEPGTHFLYNSGATFMLSALVQRLTGQTLLEYLRPRLLEALGIEDATWETNPQGINTGGWGMAIKTEDIASFGQLYLQKGLWEGERILPEAWVTAATAAQVPNGNDPNSDWAQGYGYQFWRCRHGAYRGDGAFGQYCVVMPEQDAVLAITSGVENMQAVLNLVWEHLLPAMQPAQLAPNPSAQEELTHNLANLELRPPEGQRSSPIATQVSGKQYIFEANELQVDVLSCDFKSSRLTIENEHGEHRIAYSSSNWIEGKTSLRTGIHERVAAAGAWTNDHTWVLKLYFYETPFCITITCRFVGDRLIVNWQANVGFGSTQHPEFEGRSTQT